MKISYSTEGTPTVYAEVDEDGIAHAPDGFRYADGYTSGDHSAPLIPLRRGYVIQSDGPHGWRQFYRWSDDTGEDLRLTAWRLWRRTGYQTQILRYPVTRVGGIFPWGDMKLVQDWGSRRKHIDLGLEWRGRHNPAETGGFWQ